MRPSLCIACGALLLAGCSRDEEIVTLPPAPAPAVSAAPVDHLGPLELVEGKESALGVPLPRAARLDHSFADAAYATANGATIPQLVEYFKARVREGSFTAGERSATFERVKVPSRPGVEISIRIEGALAGIRITFKDVTRPQAPDLPNEEARWRAVGMTKDGKLLDRDRLQ